ncbi:hypothetical protein AVT69_gp370 [Pseudomonas phage PhiPA3]|uniref:Uncharacterized protein 366 n=1 Tax=Pseudomonas phage PhiPA3 TaxID=998086 RepID=F8SJJ8_BPPA3|nr:hypothetical protein AVT69_gp370 [Pseudomonas phage PhiPA3]AEH03789.1 hypothetical protein [Pseudomonas phage PhiPA3]
MIDQDVTIPIAQNHYPIYKDLNVQPEITDSFGISNVRLMNSRGQIYPAAKVQVGYVDKRSRTEGKISIRGDNGDTLRLTFWLVQETGILAFDYHPFFKGMSIVATVTPYNNNRGR